MEVNAAKMGGGDWGGVREIRNGKVFTMWCSCPCGN